MRTALITGGSGGIGKACGRKLVELGYDVILTARREEPLRAAAYSASKAGMNAFALALAQEVDRDGINVHVVTPGPV